MILSISFSQLALWDKTILGGGFGPVNPLLNRARADTA